MFVQIMKALFALFFLQITFLQIAFADTTVARGADQKAAPSFAKWTVEVGKDPKIRFSFSASNATAEDPVVISIPGRELKNADRVHRVELQKRWLAKHVPAKFELESRQQVQIPFKRKDDKFGAADVYLFKDPATNEEKSYYIYLGNWP